MGELKYSLLTKKDILSAINCVVKVFLYEESMTKSLNISNSEFRVFVKLICEKMAREKMSYVCKNNVNQVVGFCLNEDLVTEPLSKSVKITSKMNPIFVLLGRLDNSYFRNKKISQRKFFHLFMVGSLKEYRNKGIARELIAKSLALAKKREFELAITEATNLKSQNLFKNHFNFKEFKKIPYKKFKFKNKFPFKSIDEEYCKLMELKVN